MTGHWRAGEYRGLYKSITRTGNRDHNGEVRGVAEKGTDWRWWLTAQYSHISNDIAGTNAVNLNIVLTPFVA